MGALTIEPSMLCHCQAIPSISSYSTNPAHHKAKKNPAFVQRIKYLSQIPQ
jgi:hypothetical protein